jgi:hypothetical protein
VALDAVLVDGDHSFGGALKDVECWAPKVRPGGLIIMDDANDPALPDLLELIELMKAIEGLAHVATLDGFGVFERTGAEAGVLLEGLRRAGESHGRRPGWDMSMLQERSLPAGFLRSRSWEDTGLDTAYELCFLARCGPGDYVYTPRSQESDRAMLHALSADRGDGQVVAAGAGPSACRVVLGHPDEAAQWAPLLQPGGVFIARDTGENAHEQALTTHATLIAGGLDGCGWFETTHWGIRHPYVLSTDAVIEFAAAAYDAVADGGG